MHETRRSSAPEIFFVTIFERWLSKLAGSGPWYVFKHIIVLLQKLLFIFSDLILRSTLSLYMENSYHPLPTPEEVLLCNSTTTAEEVITILLISCCLLVI